MSLRLALGVYGVMSLICVVFTLLLPIETKGRAMVVRMAYVFILVDVGSVANRSIHTQILYNYYKGAVKLYCYIEESLYQNSWYNDMAVK